VTCRRIYTSSSVNGESGTFDRIDSDYIYNSNWIYTNSLTASIGSITNLSSSDLTIGDSIHFNNGSKSYQLNYDNPDVFSSVYFFYSGQEPFISGEANEFIGESLALSDDGKTLAAGSSLANAGNGLVKVFNHDGDTWNQIGLDIIGLNSEGLGNSVDLNHDGSIVAIGAHTANLNSGIVKVYDLNANSWVQRPISISGHSVENLGYSISLNYDGDLISIGAPSCNLNSGMGYILEWDGSSWSGLSYGVSGLTNNEKLGSSTSISDNVNTVAFGGESANSNDGVARIYNYSGIHSSGAIGGLLFTSVQDGLSYNGLGIILDQVPGGSNPPDPPTPATATYDSLNNELKILADISNGSVDYSGLAIDLNSASNSSEILSAGFSLGLINGSGLEIISAYPITDTEGGLDKFWMPLGSAIHGSSSEKLGSAIKINKNGNYAAIGGVDGNNGDGSIHFYTLYLDDWHNQNLSLSGQAFDINDNFNIVSVGFSSANLNSGICRAYGKESNQWELIGEDILGGSANENLGSAVSINGNGQVFCTSSDSYSVNKGMVKTYDFDYISDLNINSTRVTAEKLNLDYYKLPTFDPLVIGDVWRDQGGFLKISAGWTPAVLNTLAWYDAADAFTITSNSNIISQVDDKSGNGFHLNVLTSGKTGPKTGIQTLNGLNVFTWDTIGQVLENNSFSYNQNSNGLYFAIIFKCIIDNTQDFVLAGTEVNTPGNRMALRRNGSVNSLQIIGGSGTGSNIVLGSSPGSAPEGEDFLVVSKFNGSNSHIRIDGDLVKSGNIGTNAFSSLNIGTNETESSPIKGYIAEVVFFTDSNDELKVEGYLAHKWALSYKLPDNHRYKVHLPF
jgi:hypothetical protein